MPRTHYNLATLSEEPAHDAAIHRIFPVVQRILRVCTGIRRRADISPRLAHRICAAAGLCGEQTIPGIREPRYPVVNRYCRSPAASLRRPRGVDNHRGPQETGHHRRQAGDADARQRQGCVGDGKPAGKRPEIPQMDAAWAAPGGGSPCRRAGPGGCPENVFGRCHSHIAVDPGSPGGRAFR